jgi:hypothetical protein
VFAGYIVENLRFYGSVKDMPESTLHAMKLLETLCNPRATAEEANPNELIEKFGVSDGI